MFNQLTTWSNLLLAYRRASRGKRSRPDVAAFEFRLEDNLYQLQAELQTQQYTPGPYHSFFIHDPKRRLISAASFRDRVVHLRLTIHPGAHPRPVSEGITFLGFVIYPDRIRLKRRKGIAYRRKFRGLLRQYAAGEIELDRVNASVRGWVNHTRFGNTLGLRRALLSGEIVRRP
jgi:hypothetical protein